ncbi:MAG: inorganic diphosphatase [Bacilli bacterium]|jgi:inorganic pyrophosphatase|nr:inorganic diphosphatase [Bacilli bacterium]
MLTIIDTMPKERMGLEEFVACIEISKGSNLKYELDKETGLLLLDRILFTSTHYPASYGFLPLTLAEDGDPLDVLVLSSVPLVPLSLVKCRPIGVISMVDGKSSDEKIIAVAFDDPDYNSFHSITELPKHIFEEMRHFFTVYKELENKRTLVEEAKGPLEAKEIIRQSYLNYQHAHSRTIRRG